MNPILIKNAIVADSQSPLDKQKVDILVENDVISQIAPSIEKDVETHDVQGAFVSPGWIDLRSSICDPGYEHKENLDSLEQVALAGGYTMVCCLPDTKPIVQSKTTVEYLKKASAGRNIDFLPLGAVTKGLDGEDITEMFDMHQSGAVGFSNANHAIRSAGVMHRALLYAKSFNGTVYSFPYEEQLAVKGQMAEGTMNVYLGMKGIPAVAEYLQVQRDIELAKYNNAKVHFSKISTAESVALIRKAKSEGVIVTADVAVMNIAFTDNALESFDTNYKILPPLRSENHRAALLQGLLDGTIDAICSDHTPEDIESKQVEFDYSAFGAIQLQTVLPLLIKAFGANFTPDMPSRWLAKGASKVLGKDADVLNVGQKATFTFFNPYMEWKYDKVSNRSRSANSPLLNSVLKGKVIATFYKSKFNAN